MKKDIINCFSCHCDFSSLELFTQLHLNLNPKMKAFLLMTTYGTVGGFLLGSASLAFDTPGRAPFVGASLGLYAGLAFGSYVLVSHYVDRDRKLNPQKYMDDPGVGDYGELPNQMLNQYNMSNKEVLLKK